MDVLDSDRFARRGVPENLLNELSPKLDGRAVVDAWDDPADEKILVLVNNRMALREKDFEKSPPLSLATRHLHYHMYHAPRRNMKDR